jgi:hypothetical protein
MVQKNHYSYTTCTRFARRISALGDPLGTCTTRCGYKLGENGRLRRNESTPAHSFSTT